MFVRVAPSHVASKGIIDQNKNSKLISFRIKIVNINYLVISCRLNKQVAYSNLNSLKNFFAFCTLKIILALYLNQFNSGKLFAALAKKLM